MWAEVGWSERSLENRWTGDYKHLWTSVRERDVECGRIGAFWERKHSLCLSMSSINIHLGFPWAQPQWTEQTLFAPPDPGSILLCLVLCPRMSPSSACIWGLLCNSDFYLPGPSGMEAEVFQEEKGVRRRSHGAVLDLEL